AERAARSGWTLPNSVNFKTRFKEGVRSGAKCAAVTVLLGFLFVLPRIGDGLEHWSYDLSALLKPQVSITNENVLIVYIDEISTTRFRLDPKKEWDRGQYSDLLKVLTAQGAEIVVFD